jgi:hypothetical protein
MDEELDRFKQIDLRSYARSVGYSLDPRDKSAMHHASGDKIIISRKPDGHFTYWSVRDDRDKGTIIDFIARRSGLNLGQVRKELRGWTATSSIVASALPELPVTVRDHNLVRSRYFGHPRARMSRVPPGRKASQESNGWPLEPRPLPRSRRAGSDVKARSPLRHPAARWRL